MRKFTLEEIKKYIMSQDSMGDILYYLNEKNIIEANKPKCYDCNENLTNEEREKGDVCDVCFELKN